MGLICEFVVISLWVCVYVDESSVVSCLWIVIDALRDMIVVRCLRNLLLLCTSIGNVRITNKFKFVLIFPSYTFVSIFFLSGCV